MTASTLDELNPLIENRAHEIAELGTKVADSTDFVRLGRAASELALLCRVRAPAGKRARRSRDAAREERRAEAPPQVPPRPPVADGAKANGARRRGRSSDSINVLAAKILVEAGKPLHCRDIARLMTERTGKAYTVETVAGSLHRERNQTRALVVFHGNRTFGPSKPSKEGNSTAT